MRSVGVAFFFWYQCFEPQRWHGPTATGLWGGMAPFPLQAHVRLVIFQERDEDIAFLPLYKRVVWVVWVVWVGR